MSYFIRPSGVHIPKPQFVEEKGKGVPKASQAKEASVAKPAASKAAPAAAPTSAKPRKLAEQVVPDEDAEAIRNQYPSETGSSDAPVSAAPVLVYTPEVATRFYVPTPAFRGASLRLN